MPRSSQQASLLWLGYGGVSAYAGLPLGLASPIHRPVS